MTRVVESAGRKEDDRKRNTALIPGSWFLEEQLLSCQLLSSGLRGMQPKRRECEMSKISVWQSWQLSSLERNGLEMKRRDESCRKCEKRRIIVEKSN